MERLFSSPKWKEKEIVAIHDIVDNRGKLLFFEVFQTKFSITSNFLSYLQVISAIPKLLLQKARSLRIGHRFTEENVTFQLSFSLNIDLCKMKSRDY